MLVVNVPLTPTITLVTPVETCCNCGSVADVALEQTDLRRIPLFGVGGSEIIVKLPIPYCPLCKASASRRHPGLVGVLAVSALLALSVGTCWLFWGPQVSEEIAVSVVAPTSFLLSLAGVLSYFHRRKPVGTQTSFYQPIRLKHTGHKWPAKLDSLDLEFSNREYAAQFSSVNQTAISASQLKVSSV